MSIATIACNCGSSDSIVRSFLKSIGYGDWLNIPVEKGRDRSLAYLNNLPPTKEKEMLKNFLSGASKWAIIIGYTDNEMKWSDIAHNGPKSRIEAEFIVKKFSDLI